MSTKLTEQDQHPHSEDRHGPFFTFFVDDREFRVDKPVISGAEIMDLAGIPREVGLVLILEDGTQRAFGATETIELEPGRRFKKAPRFKRG
jgi:hypothetical protein